VGYFERMIIDDTCIVSCENIYMYIYTGRNVSSITYKSVTMLTNPPLLPASPKSVTLLVTLADD